MSVLDKLPAGPFRDAIRDWNRKADELNSLHPAAPAGSIILGPVAAAMLREEIAKAKAE